MRAQRRVLLSSKLNLILAAVMLALLSIAALVLVTLNDVKSLSAQATSDQTQQLRQGRQFTQHLSGLLNDISLLERRFYRNSTYLLESAAQIALEIEQLSQSNSPVILQSFEQFSNHFQDYVQAGQRINQLSDEQDQIDARLNAEIDLLEERIATDLIDTAINGHEDPYLQQMAAVVIGYRLALLELEKQLAEEANQMLNRDATLWRDGRVEQTLAQLTLQVQTFSLSTPVIGWVTEELLASLKRLELNIGALKEAIQQFRNARVALLASREQLQQILNQGEERIADASLILSERLGSIIDRSRTTVLLISALVALIALVTIRLMISRAIRQPLQALLRGIETMRPGTLHQPIRLHRSDEWSIIEEALNKMAQALDQSYTALDAQRSSMDELAHHDPLTGLPNRLLFDDRLQHALEKSKRQGSALAVIFIDLDHFKQINDSLGHAAGDQLLQTLARRLRGCIREVDTASRQGGDEFVLLLENIDAIDTLHTIAKKLLAAIAEPVTLLDRQFHISGSLGISLSPRDGSDAQSLMRNADAAMYQAKQRGRNNYCFYEEQINLRASEYLEMESGLREALLHNELSIYYQPQYRLKDSHLIGAEALVRWHHPVKGMLLPEYFIAIAEQSGLITKLDNWVFTEVCRQLARWQQRWSDAILPQIAINLSGRQLEKPEMAADLLTIARENGCQPPQLCLELTESVFMKRDEASRSLFRTLRKQGFTLAIDDFGTGYSSLGYLQQLPLNTLKIDRSFIVDLIDNEQNAAIARSIISLGQHMGFGVLAEGIETQAQADFLIDQGCEFGQGYLYSSPLPAEDFEALLQRRTPGWRSPDRLSL